MPLSLLAYSGILTTPSPEDRLRRFIKENGIQAEILTASGKAPTTQDAARLLGLDESDIVKTIVLADKWEGRVIAIAPGDRRLDIKAISRLSGVRAPRFAESNLVQAVTGYPAGGVAPIGFPKIAPVLVDATLAERERPVIGGGGQPHLLLRINVADIIRMNQATVAAITLP